jgi:gliding motility-associated protein GldC
MLSVWDSKSKESMRIDLWTKEMPVDEMKIFHQTLVVMSDIFHRTLGRKNDRDHERFLRIFAES